MFPIIIFMIFRLGLLLLCAIFIIKRYITTNFETLKFLFLSIIGYFLAEFSGMLYTLIGPPTDMIQYSDIKELFLSFCIFSALIFTFFMLIIFLESFDTENVYNLKILLLGGFGVYVLTGYLLSTIIAMVSLSDILEGKYEQSNSLGIFNTTWLIWSIFLLMAISVMLVYILIIFRNLVVKLKNIREESGVIVLRVMCMTILSLFISTVSTLFLSNTHKIVLQSIYTIATISMTLFVVIYLRSGIHILLNETQRRLIIVTNDGLPIYSYTFIPFNVKTKLNDPGDEDVIFTGILSAISSLMSGLTGTQDELVELSMKEITVLIEKIDEDKNALLITTNPTKALREKLKSFVVKINHSHYKLPNNKINGKLKFDLNRTIAELFGMAMHTQ